MAAENGLPFSYLNKQGCKFNNAKSVE